MRGTEEFGGSVYMDESFDPNAAPPILTHSRLFPLSLLVLPVVTVVLVFVAPVASAGAALAGSELAWASLVAGGVAATYCLMYQLRQCRHSQKSLITESVSPTGVTQFISHALVICCGLGVLAVLALESGTTWGLMAVRSMVSAQTVGVTVSGLHQLYVGPRHVATQNLMQAYDAVMTTDAESMALDASVWEECAQAQAVVGLEKLQAERIHHLEVQKQELAAEVVRLHTYFASDGPELSSEPPEQQLMLQIDQQTAQLRSMKASQKTLSDQLQKTSAAKDEREQAIADVEQELAEQQALNMKMSGTMAQMKQLLQHTVQSRDEVRAKYKLLKRSVSKIVGVNPALQSSDSDLKVEHKLDPQMNAEWIQPAV